MIFGGACAAVKLKLRTYHILNIILYLTSIYNGIEVDLVCYIHVYESVWYVPSK